MSGGDKHWEPGILSIVDETLYMQEPETSRGHLRHCDLSGAGPGGGGGPQAAGGDTGSALHNKGLSVTLTELLTNAPNSHCEFVDLLFSH